MFNLSDYNHYGEVSYSVTHKYYDLRAVQNEHLHCIGNLFSVTNVDVSYANDIYPEQLCHCMYKSATIEGGVLLLLSSKLARVYMSFLKSSRIKFV